MSKKSIDYAKIWFIKPAIKIGCRGLIYQAHV